MSSDPSYNVDMKKQNQIEKRCSALLERKGLSSKNTAQARFIEDFRVYSWWFHGKYGDGLKMLKVLENDNLLFDGNLFNANFKKNLIDFIPELKSNKTFVELVKILVNNKAKGVGVGELILALLVRDWKCSSGRSDGEVAGGKRELKNGKAGGSIKPIDGDLTDKGLIDKLNKKYWNGEVPGIKKSHQKHVALVQSKAQYGKYLGELYPGAPIKPLLDALFPGSGNKLVGLEDYKKIMGFHHLKWYQQLEGFKSIVVVDPKSLEVANIAKIDDSIYDLGITTKVKMNRLADSQAVPDGYSNIFLDK